MSKTGQKGVKKVNIKNAHRDAIFCIVSYTTQTSPIDYFIFNLGDVIRGLWKSRKRGKKK